MSGHSPDVGLAELAVLTRRIAARRVPAGRSLGFPPGHVHDVANPSAEPAVSVHAYSPPLVAMSYYAVGPGAPLRRVRMVWTAHGSAEGVG